jgi:hypothetical protein
MSISLFLGVAIGMIFVWTILSLATMNIQEWVSARLKWRSRMLEKTLGKMLTDSALLDQFYNHPLIRGLFTGKENKDKPSYIPATQFSQAVLDILATTGTEASILQQQLYWLYCIAERLGRKKQATATQKITVLLGMTRKALVSEAGEDDVAHIIDSIKAELLTLQDEIPELKEPVGNLMETVLERKQEVNNALIKLAHPAALSTNDATNKIRAGVIALSIIHPQLKQTLYAILNTASQSIWQKQNELELIRLNIEEWFNNTMTRLTGWYKRRILVTTFLISLLVASLANIDAIHLVERFWSEPELRTLILDQVGNLLAQPDTSDTETDNLAMLQDQSDVFGLPIGWIGGLPQVYENPTSSFLELDVNSCTPFPTREDQLFGFWIKQRCYPIINAPLFSDVAGWISKLLGILITAAAASQGAPFWFDLLKKVINVRLTGLNPSETKKSFVG